MDNIEIGVDISVKIYIRVGVDPSIKVDNIEIGVDISVKVYIRIGVDPSIKVDNISPSL